MLIRIVAAMILAFTVAAEAPAPESAPPPETPPAAQTPAQAVPVVVGSDSPEEEETPPLPEVVARVGGQVLTGKAFQRDLEQRFQLLRVQYPNRPVDEEAFRKDTLSKLVQGMVLRELALKAGTQVTDEEVTAQLKAGRAAFPTDEAYREHLEGLGLTEEELREELRMNLLADRFMDEKMKKVITPRDEVKMRFDQMLQEGVAVRPQRTANFRHILIKPEGDTDDAWKAAEEEAAALRERIVAGEDFASLARELSDDLPSRERGGLYREAMEHQMPPAIGELLRTQEKDVISPPVRSQFGWHIVRVEQRFGAGEMTFQEAEPRIREVLIEEKRMKLIAQLVENARDDLEIELTP